MQTAKLKYTHIESQRQQALTHQRRVCRLLGWDELQYNMFMWEQGCRYLEYYIPSDSWGRQMLEQNKLYWNWWKNQWAKRDAEFLSKIQGGDYEAVRLCYNEYHDAKTLASEIYISGVVIGISYKRMIQELFDEVNSKT
jgi:hypothetical protein